jgi:hypothetical protein
MRFELIADQNIQVGDLGRYEAFNHDGTVLSGWPIEFSKNSSFQQPLLTDMNNDGILDIIGGSFEFGGATSTNLYAWNTGLTYFPDRIVNPVYQFNAAHDGVYNGNGVIPVELISYNAVVNDDDVTLRWSTSTELNNSHYEIFRNDVLIAVVDGNGTTTTQSDYSYVDENLSSGSYSYTLIQIDFDGTKKNLGTIELSLNEIPKEFSLSQNYPNPFNPVTKISYSISDINSFVQLKVFDVLGHEVATLVNEVQPAGTYDIEFPVIGGSASGENASGLSSGIYFYTLKAGNFYKTKKMILLK